MSFKLSARYGQFGKRSQVELIDALIGLKH